MEPFEERVELQVRLRLSTSVPWALVIPVAVFGLAIFAAIAAPLVEAGRWDALLTLAFALLFVPLLLIAATRNRRNSDPVVMMTSRGMHLPLLRHEAGLDTRYRDINALFMRPGPRGFVWIGTPLGHFRYPRKMFVDPADLERMVAFIRERLEENLGDASKRMAEFAEQQHSADRVYRRDPIVVPVVCVVLGVIAGALALAGAWDRMFSMASWGANVPALVKQGEYWRLFTASWVHLDLVQLLFDGLLIAVVGVRIERLLGPHRTLLVVLVGALFGQLALLTSSSAELSAGAAPIAFALIGAYAFVAQRFKSKMPIGLAPPLRSWVLLGLMLLLIAFSLPTADFPTYLGGLMGGVLVAGLSLADDSEIPPEGHSPAMVFSAALLLALLVGASAWGINDSIDQGETPELTVGRAFLEREVNNADRLNQYAWQIAVEAETSSAALELAHKAATQARRVSNDDPAVVDTWALVRFRQNEVQVAVQAEHDVLNSRPDAFIASQFTRFVLGLSSKEAATLEVSHHEVRGAKLLVSNEAPVQKTLYAAVLVDDAPQGLLRLDLQALQRSPWLQRQGIEWVWPQEAVLRVVWSSTTALSAQSWILEPAVFEYPGPADIYSQDF